MDVSVVLLGVALMVYSLLPKPKRINFSSQQSNTQQNNP